MIGRLLPWRKRAQLLALGLYGLLLAGHVTPAQAQTLPVCAVDLDGNGDAGDPGEVANCTIMADEE